MNFFTHNNRPLPQPGDSNRFGFITAGSGFIEKWESDVRSGKIDPKAIIARLNYEAERDRGKGKIQ